MLCGFLLIKKQTVFRMLYDFLLIKKANCSAPKGGGGGGEELNPEPQ